MSAYAQKNEAVLEHVQRYDEAAIAGTAQSIYRFDHNVMDADAVAVEHNCVDIRGAKGSISLELPNPYADMCD